MKPKAKKKVNCLSWSWWYPNSKVYCDGQLILKVGSTKPRLDVDVWSGNHPFYTGSQELLDIDGRVARFLAKYGLEEEFC